MHSKKFHAMGSEIFYAIDSQDQTVHEIADTIPQWFEDWENIFSRFKPASELCYVNKNQGEFTQVSPEFIEVLDLALQMEKWTNGLFSPSLLPALEKAGYTESFESSWFHEPFIVADPFVLSTISDGIQVNAEPGEVQLPYGLKIDLGGIVKSWAAHQAVARLSAYTPTLVNAGGDISVSGLQSNGDPWPIALTDPYNPERDLCLLMIERGGVATSGRDRRRWMLDGQWKHHIIDPRRQTSAQTDVLTATVIADDAMTAEVAAKVAVILGSRDAEDWFSQQTDLEYLLVLENNRVVLSRGFNQYLWSESWQQTQTA